MIKVSPIDKNISPEFAAAVDSFIAANIGLIVSADKAWAVYWKDKESFKILGIATCNISRHMADVPVYHVLEGNNRADKVQSMRAHEALFTRVTGFIADMVGSGAQAFFYISPDAQEHWKEFSKKVNGRNANRFVMEV